MSDASAEPKVSHCESGVLSGSTLSRRNEFWLALAIAAAGLILLARCLGANFLPYDDPIHIHQNPLVFGRGSLLDVFRPRLNSTYFPITTLSYRLDHWLFAGWMTDAFSTWAPGIRLMTWLYHSLAAIILWRFLLQLGTRRGAAFFVAMTFAVHPTACETVCWISERKNALAGLFGFAALYAFVRWRDSGWRIPLTATLYALACLSKPSALGLLPVMVALEVLGASSQELRAKSQEPHPQPAITRAALFVLLVIVSLAAVLLNLEGHRSTLMPPPGGSLFSATLTDAEVLARYLYNLLLPINLSFVYFVEPITSLLDARFVLYLLALAGACGLTMWLAENRRRALFGWLWFFGALSPCLNIVSIPQIMQDRYIYLSLPGFFLVLTEAAAGLRARFPVVPTRAFFALAGAYLAMFAALGCARGALFTNQFLLFSDAVAKQPHAAHARYGLAVAYAIKYDEVKNTPALSDAEKAEREKKLLELRRHVKELDRAFIDECPDAMRQINFDSKAYNAGRYALELGELDAAERYFQKLLNAPRYLRVLPNYMASTLDGLSRVRMKRGKPQEALALAERAVQIAQQFPDGDIPWSAYFARGQAAAACAQLPSTPPEESKRLRLLATGDLRRVNEASSDYKDAQRLLKGLGQ
jgi:tetratricopeptide (TPR) repeat protein